MDRNLYEIITDDELANQIANSTFLSSNTVKEKCLNIATNKNKKKCNIGDVLLSKELKKIKELKI